MKPSHPYAELARALLDTGDPATSVVRFLRNEYGLDGADAKKAIAVGRRIPSKTPEQTFVETYVRP